ncbi:hypothetical protein [Streptomyces xanthochromogenes]
MTDDPILQLLADQAEREKDRYHPRAIFGDRWPDEPDDETDQNGDQPPAA